MSALQSIVFWLAAGVGVLSLVCIALAAWVVRMAHNFITKEEE